MTIILKPRKFRVGGVYSLRNSPGMYATVIKISTYTRAVYPIRTRLRDSNTGTSWTEAYTSDGRFFATLNDEHPFDLIPGEI